MTESPMCSYCLRPRVGAMRLFASPLAAICEDCARNAVAAFESDPTPSDLPGPATPWERLDNEALLARIPEVAKASREVQEHLGRWVAAARERHISWARIGEALDMTRQSAWERFRG